jgi:large subunit ribosomal protein L18
MLTDLRSPGRTLRQARVRRRIQGTDVRPRLTVFRSLQHIYAQVISDESGRTLAAASTLSGELREALGDHAKNKAAARKVGELIAKKAKEAGITKVVFDRNGFLYHGRVQSLAEGARESGLEF